MTRLHAQAARAPLGQNFLVDDGAAAAIVAALGPLENRLMVEVGPGSGALTSLLARRAGRLVAVEFDRELATELSAAYADSPNVRVINGDIRSVDLTALAAEETPEPGSSALLVGNLPYYITSDILLHLVEHSRAIETAVVMVQREVAERIAARPGTPDYGLLSSTVQLAADAELLFTLPPEAFRPAPQVFSSVVRLTMRPRYAELGVDRPGFERFLRQCFAQKRKTLGNNLRAAGYGTATITAALAAANVETNRRAETVDLATFALLYRGLVRR